MGSGGSSAPKESVATINLTNTQAGILTDINKTVQSLDPITFQQLGLKQEDQQVINPAWEKWNENVQTFRQRFGDPGHNFEYYLGKEPTKYIPGKAWVPLTEQEKYSSLSGMDKNLYDLGMLQYDRLNDAYSGNLGISPALEADLSKQQAVLEQTLAQKLGPNWATSTPGIQAINEFQKQAGLVREEARRAMLSEGQGLLLQNLGYQQGAKQQQLSNLVNIPSARYQANLSSGQELLNSSIAKDNYYNSYKASQSGGVSKGTGAASGALMGAATGAYVGSVVPGIGTAIGAIGGGLIGGIGGLLAGN
jgi:hypothetical protein